MTNIFKKSLLLVIGCLAATIVWGQTTSFTAAEIKAGTTKGAVSVSTDFNVANKQMCKENSKGVKIDAVEGGNSANNVDEKYVEIKATSDISNLVLHATYNSSGSGKKMAFVYWGENETPANDNVLSSELVTFTGYDGTCDANYAEVALPAGVRTIRIYRQLKNFDGKGYVKGTNYGENTTYFIADIDVTAGPAGPSTDATLKDLLVNEVSVEGFTADKTDYEVELPAGTTDVPTVEAKTNNDKAKAVITPAEELPGKTTVTVTAEDTEVTKTYTITFTIASGAPKVTDAKWKDMVGTPVIDQIKKTITGRIANGSDLTAIVVDFAGQNIETWADKGDPQDFSNGPVEFTFSSPFGPMETYSVSITEAPLMSSDATLSSLTYGDNSVPGFAPDKYDYTIKLTAGIKTPPVIAAKANDSNAEVKIDQAQSVPGVGKVTVTAQDGTTTLTYTVNYTVDVPQSGLTIHVPEIYEAKTIAGGYGGKLSVLNGREYEVYYANRDTEGKKVSITTEPGDRKNGIENQETASEKSAKAKDGWMEVTVSSISGGSSAKAGAVEEFEEVFDEWRIGSSSLKLHIQGYDRFNYYAADKSVEIDSKTGTFKKEQRFQVFIDGIMQEETQCSTNNTVRHYDLTTGEHIIEVKGMSGGDSKLFAFSLRVAEEPRAKWLKGNDSTQVVLQTAAPKPVYYFVKYAAKGQTELVWEGGKEATGLELQKVASSALGDTLVLTGTANCPVGQYNYAVVTTMSGNETSRVSGKLFVASEIDATSDTIVSVRQGMQMKEIQFRYYALSDKDVTLTWTGATPAGISGSGSNGTYVIEGKPNVEGQLPMDFPYTICVDGGNCITGKITVKDANLGANPVLYLCKKENNAEKDGVYNYLKGKGVNFDPLEANEKMRDQQDYQPYKWILISTDVDADNGEVLAIMKQSPKPVLNMKAFTYAPGRVTENGWGEPNNGSVDSVTNNGCNIYVQRPDHPIFKGFNKKVGDKISVFTKLDSKGVMPITVTMPGTMCLATAYTQSIDDYYKDGEERQTILHEIPADMRGGMKYICLPLARNKETNLSSDGKKLLDAVVDYLTGSAEAGIQLPMLQINSFTIEGINADINQAENTITLTLSTKQYKELDSLRNAEPVITWADETYTHVVTDKIDLIYTTFMPKTYIVTDYISRRAYNFSVRLYTTEGIEETYESGQWVNIFDIYGRKVATTNEDIYTMQLPRGIYIVVTENGQTIKLLK